jgi:hypothetical protein
VRAPLGALDDAEKQALREVIAAVKQEVAAATGESR